MFIILIFQSVAFGDKILAPSHWAPIYCKKQSQAGFLHHIYVQKTLSFYLKILIFKQSNSVGIASDQKCFTFLTFPKSFAFLGCWIFYY